MHQVPGTSWGSSELVLCSVAYSLKSPGWDTPWAPRQAAFSWPELLGYCRVNSWILSHRTKLLGKLGCKTTAERSRIYEVNEFHSVTVHKQRVSVSKTSHRFQLWRQDTFLFPHTMKGSFHMLPFNCCIWLCYAFSEAFHTELCVLTLLLNPEMTNPRFQGTSDIFLMWDSTFGLIFWSWEQIKLSVALVRVCSQSLRTWVCSESLLHETFPVMLGRGKGVNHNSKTGLSHSLGYLGFILSDL